MSRAVHLFLYPTVLSLGLLNLSTIDIWAGFFFLFFMFYNFFIMEKKQNTENLAEYGKEHHIPTS